MKLKYYEVEAWKEKTWMNQEVEAWPYLFCVCSITLNTKPDKDTMWREQYRPITLMKIDAEVLEKILVGQ